MSIQRQTSLIHWNYFLAIEEDLDRLSRFVDFSGNDEAFSVEIGRILTSATSEVDIVLKQLCKVHNPQSRADNINAYYLEISGALPTFIPFQITIPKHELTLQPWVDWDKNQPPFWWQDNNKVKHHRHDHFDKANLKNCLNSVGALYIAILYLYKTEAEAGDLLQFPKLFNVADAHFGGTRMGRYGNSFKYVL